MAAGQLGGQLYPTDDIQLDEGGLLQSTMAANGNAVAVKEKLARNKTINLSFGQAIQEWNKHNYKEAIKMFKKHVQDYPDSPWASEAVLHTGCDATYNGRYTEAEESFNWILNQNKGKDHEGAKLLMNKAKSRLGILKVYQNNFKEAKRIFSELKKESIDWRDRTYASHWIQRLSRYTSNQLAMLNCGTQALAYLLEKDGKKAEARKVVEMLPESFQGHRIKDLSHIASKLGYDLAAIRVSPLELNSLPLPAIMHVNRKNEGDSGHYWILEKVAGDNLKLFDPQSGMRFSQSIEEFTREWSGNALVFSNKEMLPGISLKEGEMEQIYGGCCGVPRSEDDMGDPQEDAGGLQDDECSNGAPVWNVNMINMNLFMTDTPMWYTPTIGPPVKIQLSYNSQSSIAQYEPFGNKWQFNYASYLVVDTGGNVTIFMPDGRRDVYAIDYQGGYTKPYGVFNTLTKIAENHFELAFSDGAVYVYNIPQGTSSLQPFLVEIKDAYNQKLTFGYNNNVQLTTITDASGKVTTINYNPDDLIDRVDDPFGRSAAFEYDANRNLSKITDMGGYWTSLTYDVDVYLTSVENSKGRWSFYIEPADGIPANADNYPPPGDLMWENYRITVTNPLGGKEEYFYYGGSGYGWYVSPRDYITWESQSMNNFKVNTPKITYLYTETSPRGEIYKILYPEGGYIEYGYNDPYGNRTRIKDPHRHAVNYVYNSKGRITAFTDAKDNITTFNYYPNNIDVQEIKYNLSSTLEDDNILLKTFTYNGSTHDIATITDRLGNVTEFNYNSYGQLTAITQATGTSVETAMEMTYDPVKHELMEIKRNGNTVSSFTHDNADRVRTRTDDAGLTLIYDYNNLNNVTKITYPDDKFTSYTYSGCCPHLIDTITDRSGRVTTYKYDSLKRLTEVVNPDGGIMKYDYDANGNLIKFNDTNNSVNTFEYDNDNRMTRKTYADGKVAKYTYDSAGLLTKFTNSRNIAKSYTYDANHNPLSINYSDTTPDVTFTYDDYDRVETMTDGIGLHDYGYDDNNRLISVDGPLADDTITYGYDELDQLKILIPQLGQAINYGYDSLGRLTTIQPGSSTFTYGYAGVNPLIQTLTRPNGSITEYLYNDPLKRLTEITNKKSTQEIINKHVFTYNNLDLIGAETITTGTALDSFTAGQKTYSYNKLNQLLSSTNPAQAFTYDEDGNMTQGYTPEGYVFTATYDAENRLKNIQYTDNGNVIHRTEYFYAGDSILAQVKKFENGILVSDTRFVKADFLPVQERDASNAITREYTWGLNLGGGIGGLLNLKQGGANYNYLYDGKGNVSALIDGSQNIVASYRYDVFGRPLKKTGILNQPYRFSTKYYDEQTGLPYYGYRFYNPTIGKWMTRDPLGEVGGINLSQFVGNNPVNFIDPRGLFYFGKRPLSGLPWITGASSNPIDDYFNTELSHEHGFFEDGTGENIGFGLKGRFSEDPAGRGYRYENKHYDDDLMRKALKNIKDREYSNLPWKKNNCQDWADSLRQEYESLKRER
ncbi:MAG: hypothetical protein HY808_02220 [Nitrospirae bacterium]|nr:hypothetical protein [Nitrospirota bacterium]